MDVDFREIRQLERALSRAAGPESRRALNRAFSSTLRASKTVTKRIIAGGGEYPGRYNVSQRVVGQRLRVGNVDRRNFRFSVYGNYSPLNLAEFKGARQLKRSGVKARILKRGAPKSYRRSFMTESPRTAFQRVGRSRLPIRPLVGPSVGAMLTNDETVDGLSDFALEKYESELARLMRVALRG